MLHFMTVTETYASKFRCGKIVTVTHKYRLNWEGVKKVLDDTRDHAKRVHGTYSITLAAYRGQPLY